MILDVFYLYLRPILCSFPHYYVLIGLNSFYQPGLGNLWFLGILASLEH